MTQKEKEMVNRIKSQNAIIQVLEGAVEEAFFEGFRKGWKAHKKAEQKFCLEEYV